MPKKKTEEKELDFSKGWPKNEHGRAECVDLFKGESWLGGHWMHIWRDDTVVFISVDNVSITFPVEDFVDIALILGIVGNVMTEDVCPDCVEEKVNDELKYRTEFIEKQKQEAEAGSGENEGGRGGVSLH